jgi:hypothetical protein
VANGLSNRQEVKNWTMGHGLPGSSRSKIQVKIKVFINVKQKILLARRFKFIATCENINTITGEVGGRSEIISSRTIEDEETVETPFTFGGYIRWNVFLKYL